MGEPVKRKVGKPLKFETPDAMAKAINAYFEETDFSDLTITGLALAIGTNRQVLTDYEKREGYSHVVKNAKCIIEHSYEVALKKGGGGGIIFALKNFDWTDKTEHELSGPDNGPIEVKGIEVIFKSPG